MPRTSKGVPSQWIKDHAGHEGAVCLIWPFARKSNGYANLSSGPAYRVMCRLVHGDPPTVAHHAAHSCGNGRGGCINPKHLRWASPAENENDKNSHGTSPRGEQQGKSKLIAEQVLEIRRLYATGTITQAALAQRFGVKIQAISDITRRKNWAWLTELAEVA